MELDRNEYLELINDIKNKIVNAQLKAITKINQEMLLLYWQIGKMILHNQEKEGWGSKIIEQISSDLNKAFPKIKGFSARNLKYMRKFANEYDDFEIVQQLVAQLSWGHNIVLFEKVTNIEERMWYIKQCIESGWSRNILIHQIESNLYKRQALEIKSTNFENTLLKPQSELAVQTMKDPYIFDFLNLTSEAKERQLESELVKHITKFLLELGSGFAFIKNQYHLEIEGQDYYIDLLFYHLKLRCYVAIELKTGEFKPEYAGKINFYLSALDEVVKREEDNPSIGIILCKSKNKLIVEYALKDMSKPIGVSQYEIVQVIPNDLKTSLPTIEEFEETLSEELEEE